MKGFTYNRYNVNTFIAGYPGKNDNCGYSRNRDINDNMVVGSFTNNKNSEIKQFSKFLVFLILV